MLVFPEVHLDLNFLDGWLAGDGNLRLRLGRHVAVARHGTSKFGYREYVKVRLESMGLGCHSSEHHRPECRGFTRPQGYVKYSVDTRAHPVLTEQYSRWYPDGKKAVPADFRLSPDSLLQWFLGDGRLNQGAHPQITVFLPTVPCLDDLHNRLKALFGDVRLFYRSQSGVCDIHFGGNASHSFFSYIGPCPVPDYSYRWPNG